MAKITINMDSLKSGRDWVRHKVNDGSNIYRILPPFGDASVHNNYPYRRWSICWLQDPKSGKRKPFATPKTDSEECPIQEYSDALNKYIEAKLHHLKADGLSETDIKAEMEGLRSVQWNIKPQHIYAYNACDQAGSVGLLEIKSTAHKAMKKMMNQYIKDYGQDPTSLNSDENDSGVWFNITKEGKGKDTEYGVVFHQTRQKMNGQLVKIDDRTALPEHVVNNYESLAYDLNSIYTKKNYDELREILMFNLSLLAEEVPEAVLEGYGVDTPPSTTEAVSKVQQAPKKSATKVTLNLNDADDADDEPAPVRKAASAPMPVKPSPSTKKTTVSQSFEDDELSALTAEILGD